MLCVTANLGGRGPVRVISASLVAQDNHFHVRFTPKALPALARPLSWPSCGPLRTAEKMSRSRRRDLDLYHRRVDNGHRRCYLTSHPAHRGRLSRRYFRETERVRSRGCGHTPAPGRRRASCPPALRPACKVLTGLGQAKAGNARSDRVPRKPGLTLSHWRRKSLWREPRWNAGKQAGALRPSPCRERYGGFPGLPAFCFLSFVARMSEAKSGRKAPDFTSFNPGYSETKGRTENPPAFVGEGILQR